MSSIDSAAGVRSSSGSGLGLLGLESKSLTASSGDCALVVSLWLVCASDGVAPSGLVSASDAAVSL